MAGVDQSSALEQERRYYEQLYSGFAQQHFAKPAVVAFRKHLAGRILKLTGAGPSSRVLSIGSGTGDTELLLARRIGSLVGIDISARGVEQAIRDAASQGIRNVSFLVSDLDDGTLVPASFDIIIAVFFLHHLPDRVAAGLPLRISSLLKPGGVFYALDPSYYRLSGAIGKLLIPGLMKKYQTAGEEPLRPAPTWAAFRRAGLDVGAGYYDFMSTPLAGLLPSWQAGYRAARTLDNLLIRVPGLRFFSSNFEILGRKA